MRVVDLIVLASYLAVVATLGLSLGRQPQDPVQYSIGDKDLPWWAVCFSIVATETSSLTVISVPGIAYSDACVFVGLAIGYLVGRSLVALIILPIYMHDRMVSAYQFIGQRFGLAMQALVSIAFLVTRVLAEGVRLFASAIPISLLLSHAGIHVSYFVIILGVTAITVTYTYAGGIRAVVWTDAIQMVLYICGALICIVFLFQVVGFEGVRVAYSAGKFRLFDYGAPVLTSPYAIITALLGGAAYSTASHGADQLIVQRLLACRSLWDARRAVICSAIFVMLQFGLFSLVGVLLWAHLHGQSIQQLGLSSSDQLFPNFIITELPQGLSGLLIAAILAATMGSLSSAMNSLSTSTLTDLLRGVGGNWKILSKQTSISRILTIMWAIIFVIFGSIFSDKKSQIVLLGLQITGYTYGALLGSFLLGMWVNRAHQTTAIIAFSASIFSMVCVMTFVTVSERPIAFPWLVPIGVAITITVGTICSGIYVLRNRNQL